MSEANRSRFVYVTFIRTTPAKLIRPEGTVTDTGELLEIEAPRRMVILCQWKPSRSHPHPGH